MYFVLLSVLAHSFSRISCTMFMSSGTLKPKRVASSGHVVMRRSCPDVWETPDFGIRGLRHSRLPDLHPRGCCIPFQASRLLLDACHNSSLVQLVSDGHPNSSNQSHVILPTRVLQRFRKQRVRILTWLVADSTRIASSES